MPTHEPHQLELFGRWEPPRAAPRPRPERPAPADQLAAQLAPRLRGRLRQLTLTDNRVRIVSARPTADGGLAVRIHRSFADAPRAILDCVATFLLGHARRAKRTDALAEIRRFFDRHRPTPETPAPPRRRRTVVLRPVGRHFDLRTIRDDLNRRYFDGQLEVNVTWGRAPSARPRRRRRGFSIRLGSYTAENRVVRIHRALDRPDVPLFVVESVVHHEMLHAALPSEPTGRGRRRLHSPDFRRRERRYEHYAAAERWIKANLGRLTGAQ